MGKKKAGSVVNNRCHSFFCFNEIWTYSREGAFCKSCWDKKHGIPVVQIRMPNDPDAEKQWAKADAALRKELELARIEREFFDYRKAP